LKRKQSRYNTPRKKRRTASSTVASRMYAAQSVDAFYMYMKAAYMSLMVFLVSVSGRCPPGTDKDLFMRVTGAMSAHYFSQVVNMIKLESLLLDMHNSEDDIPFSKGLVRIRLESFADDNECESMTRFTRGEIQMILNSLDMPEYFRMRYNPNNYKAYYKFHSQELFIYMLRKMCTGRSHKDLADAEFGGCSGRWGRGYSYMVKILDGKWYRAIGPAGLRLWVHLFPEFAESIREYIHRKKARVDQQGNITFRGITETVIPAGEFNIFSFTDCTVYECCRPGSGPAANEDGSQRRDGWYIRQRAFYDGYHRGMEACVKVLTICLPNGLTCAVYGPAAKDGFCRLL